MAEAVVGGNIRYPSLQSIADLFRVSINDSFAGATNTPGEGLVMTNSNPDLLTFMGSSIRDMYSDLRNVGDPALLLDNYLLLGIPPLAEIDPTVQVCLSYAGYFNGYIWSNLWTLPISCQTVERLWERWSTTAPGGIFVPMEPAPFGLPPIQQTARMGQWEMRQNAIWMPGAMLQVDLRIRCRITFPQVLDPANVDFDTAYVPILSCENAVEAGMRKKYAARFAPELKADAKQDYEDSLFKLKLEVNRQMQNTEYQRIEYGDEATEGFGIWSQL
jgi:hypothetical protein